MSAREAYNSFFAHLTRSREWHAGALRGLEVALGERIAGATPLPYTLGTAAFDAFGAGVDAGLIKGRHLREEAA
ncbi:MAG: hypothetical protein FWC58_04185 [Desulfobulbus sp.]|nr:hypothetical protein [Desulfobulbus sp.]